MDLQSLMELRKSLVDSLEKVESEIVKLRGDRKEKSSKVQYYSNNKFIEIDSEVIAIAILLQDPGITVNDLAEKMGISRASLYRRKELVKYLKARRK